MQDEIHLKNPPVTLIPLKGVRERIIFKHRTARELEIAREFVRRGILRGEYIFNVWLAPPERPRRPFESEEEYRLWQFLRGKEIDAICITDTAIYIIEFKDRVRSSAIGQLKVYKRLFTEQYKPLKPIKLLLVAGEDDPQVRKIAQAEGIEVIVLGIPAYTRRRYRA